MIFAIDADKIWETEIKQPSTREMPKLYYVTSNSYDVLEKIAGDISRFDHSDDIAQFSVDKFICCPTPNTTIETWAIPFVGQDELTYIKEKYAFLQEVDNTLVLHHALNGNDPSSQSNKFLEGLIPSTKPISVCVRPPLTNNKAKAREEHSL